MAGPAGATVHKGERAAVSPAAVLDAALSAFAERGYHGTSMKEIAERLGVRTPSLYNHMTSKQGLLVQIVRETSQGVWDDFQAATDGVPGVEERLEAAIHVYALRHAHRRREALVVNRDISSLDEPARGEILQLRRRHEHAVRALLEEGMTAGVFMRQPASLVSFAALEMCVSIARWFQADGAFTAEEVATQYSQFALRMATGDVPSPPRPA